MSDTVVVMNDGDIQQIGTPQDIYNEPVERVCRRALSGRAISLHGIMHRGLSCRICREEIPNASIRALTRMEPVEVVVRPEDIEITPATAEFLCGTVTAVTFKGVHYEMHCGMSMVKTWRDPFDGLFSPSARRSGCASRLRTSISCTARRSLPRRRPILRRGARRIDQAQCEMGLLSVYRLDDSFYGPASFAYYLFCFYRPDGRLYVRQHRAGGGIPADACQKHLSCGDCNSDLPCVCLSLRLCDVQAVLFAAENDDDARYAPDVDELSAAHLCVAGAARGQRRYQFAAHLYRAVSLRAYQYVGRGRARYGLQLYPLHDFTAVFRHDEDRQEPRGGGGRPWRRLFRDVSEGSCCR